MECNDDGSNQDPEDRVKTTKFVASPVHLQNMAFMSRSLSNLNRESQ